MDKSQITTLTLVKYLGFAQGYVTTFPKERSTLTYALQKLLDRHKSVREKYNKDRAQALEEAQIEFCTKDKAGNFEETSIEHTNGQVLFRKKFTKENEAKMKKRVDEEYDKIDNEKIDFEPHIVDVPKGIDITWVKALSGFVFKEMTDAEEKEWYLSQADLDAK